MAKVKAAQNDLPAAMSGESVTGAKSDPAVTIHEPEEFTWMTTNESFPGQSSQPRNSAIPLLMQIVSDDFMKKVFEEIDER